MSPPRDLCYNLLCSQPVLRSDTRLQAIHEVMEQQSVSIAKAGITTTLNARTAVSSPRILNACRCQPPPLKKQMITLLLQVLAAANPHYGRYNVKKTISENINLPVALLSRFDLLFLLRDIANPDLDLQLAIHVCSVHQFLKIPDRQPGESKIADPKALKDHIAQARKVQPVVPQELTEYVSPPACEARDCQFSCATLAAERTRLRHSIPF
jgi:DNA replication licensing factor MCM7